MKRLILALMVLAVVLPAVGAEEAIVEEPVAAAETKACAEPISSEALPKSVFDLPLGNPDGVPAAACEISVDCESCGGEPVSCSGPTGTCYSGGSGCNEWVQCGGGAKIYCEEPGNGGGGGGGGECPREGASCSKDADCTLGGGLCNFCRCFGGTCGCP